MQKVLYILSIAPANNSKLIDRLKHEKFEPDFLESINSTPSSNITLSLIITVYGEKHIKIAERTFQNFQATIIEGPQDLEPTLKQKIKEHAGYVGKETLLIFVESLAAVHAVVGIILLHQHIPVGNLSVFDFLQFIGISAIPSFAHFLTSHKKYQKVIT